MVTMTETATPYHCDGLLPIPFPCHPVKASRRPIALLPALVKQWNIALSESLHTHTPGNDSLRGSLSLMQGAVECTTMPDVEFAPGKSFTAVATEKIHIRSGKTTRAAVAWGPFHICMDLMANA